MRLEEDLRTADQDPEAAARVLSRAAELLRIGAPLPPALAAHLADAFEVAAAKGTPQERVKMLGRELKLTRTPGRPSKLSEDEIALLAIALNFDDDLDNLTDREWACKVRERVRRLACPVEVRQRILALRRSGKPIEAQDLLKTAISEGTVSKVMAQIRSGTDK